MQKYLSDLEEKGEECICKVYDFGYLKKSTGETRVYAIIERLEMDLYTRIDNQIKENNGRDFRVMDCTKYFEAVLTGLMHMNKNGFVHLDMKNENVGIDLSGNGKIFDFGFATHLEGFPGMDNKEYVDFFIEKPQFGNPLYQDPYFVETLKNSQELLGKIHINFDVYSVGLMMLITYFSVNLIKNKKNTPPYLEHTWDQLQFDMSDFRSSKKKNEELIHLIKQMIKQNPSVRITCEKALLDARFKPAIIYPVTNTQPEKKPGMFTSVYRAITGTGKGGTLKKKKRNRKTKRNRRKTRSSK